MSEQFVALAAKPVLSVADVAALMGCSTKTVYRRTAQGQLRPIRGFEGRPGSNILFSQNTIRNFINRTR
jgi:Helix-turn-helix domain